MTRSERRVSPRASRSKRSPWSPKRAMKPISGNPASSARVRMPHRSSVSMHSGSAGRTCTGSPPRRSASLPGGIRVMPRMCWAASTAVSGSEEIAKLACIPASAPRQAIAAAISCGVPISRPKPTMEKTTVPRAVSSTKGENDEASASNFSWVEDGAYRHANMINQSSAGALCGAPVRNRCLRRPGRATASARVSLRFARARRI